jgi:hypothetical protein
VRLGQPPLVDGGTTGAEHALGIPPAGGVHLAEAADGGAEPEEAFQIYGHDVSPAPCLLLAEEAIWRAERAAYGPGWVHFATQPPKGAGILGNAIGRPIL